MSSAADRNLLLGILALQMDFITRDQLIEGMNAWVLVKQRPLGDLLVERGALAAADLAVLAPMVGRHIAKHGGAAQSLATLNSITSVKEALTLVPDGEVQASLAQLADTNEQIELPQTIGAELQQMGTRYVIERPHARGGLGEVFVARDSELNRKVALKHIQDRHADDPASRSLFLIEGEITGGLEHPGIIPVYGLGRYADGRPFYAMRFVEGDSLLTAIERYHRPTAPLDASAANLAFRDLLRRFIDVCNAVAYAHRRGVLHRDLKPGNVLLGEFGETLVIDWGMAKVLGRASADLSTAETGPLPLLPATDALATVGHAAHGTPGYMSPEQAAGRIDELGPATDIYSLGATLYHLLAGRPPLTRDDGDVIGRAIKGDFSPARLVKPGVPRALDAICSRALALRPEERYGSVMELAEDVEHWLADEPVSAWREPWMARNRRWMRKNPGRVAALTATVLIGLLAATVGAVLIEGKNRELARANEDLDKANTRLSEAVTRETTERRRADDRTHLANERFTLALDAFKQQVFDADRLLVNRAGTQELRKAIMTQAVDGLKKLAREAEKPQGAETVRASAHVVLGDVYLEIDGQVEKARSEYQLAFDLFKQLAEANPRDSRVQHNLFVSHNKIGDVFLRQGKVQKALEQYQHGLRISKRQAEADPKHAQAQRDLSLSHTRIGDVLLQQGEVQKAMEHYQDGLTIDKRLAEAAPKEAQAQRHLVVLHTHIGDVQLRQGEVQKALGQFQECLKISEGLADADPKDAQAQRDLSVSHSRIGDVLLRQREVQKALEQFHEQLRISNRLAGADPKNAQAQRDLSVSHSRIGDVLLQQGEVQKAMGQFQECLKIGEGLADADPNDAQAQRDLSALHSRIGDVLRRQGEVQKAMEQYQEGLKISKQLADGDPKDAQSQRNLALSHSHVGDLLLRQRKMQKAMEQYQEGLKISKQLAEADPKDAQALSGLSAAHEKIGDVLVEQRELQKALEQYRGCMTINKRLAEADPKDAQAQRGLHVAHMRIGVVLFRQGEVQKALAQFQEGLTISKRLAEADPKDAQAQRDLSVSHECMGNLRRQQGEVQKALEQFQECLKINKGLAEGDPKNAQAQRALSVSHCCISDVLLLQGEFQKAMEQSQEDLRIIKRLAEADPKNAQAQLDLSVSHSRIGTVLFRQGDVQKAMEQYQEGLKIGKQLAEANPKDPAAQLKLANSHSNIGDVLERQGELQKALDQFQDSLKIQKRLAETDPKDAQAQRGLAPLHERIGIVLLQQGEVQQALEQCQEQMRISTRLADGDRQNFVVQMDLVSSYFRMGQAQREAGHYEKAERSFEQGAAILLPLDKAGKLKGTAYATRPGILVRQVRLCRAAVKAMESLDAALKQPADLVFALLAERCRVLAMRGQHADAAATAEKLVERAKTAQEFHEAGRAFCRCAAAAPKEQERYVARAVEILGKARDAGAFKDPRSLVDLKTSRDFDPLRLRDDFKKLLAGLEKGK